MTNLKNQKSPNSLKAWFIIHFVVDILFAIPLMVFPIEFLQLLDWNTIDPFATRIVAAALFGIGIESWLGRNANVETYQNMLNLKIIWSGAVIIGTILSIYQTTYSTTIAEWLLLITFLFFHVVWIYWRVRLSTNKIV